MKIVVTSRSFSRNPVLRQELTRRFASDPDVEIQFNDAGESLAGSELVDFLAGAQRAIIALEKIDHDLLEHCPDLRVIGKYGVGLNNIDLDACAEHNVEIGWRAGVNRQSVAEMAISLMIAAQRRLFEANFRLRDGRFGQLTGPELSASTVGIVGFGHVGQALAQLLRAFGAKILVNDIVDFTDSGKLQGAQQVDFETLLVESDVVSLHVPSTPQTYNLIDERALSLMKSSAVLVNSARGDVVELAALKAALQNGEIAAAAIDVFAPEPPTDEAFINLPNLIATAHMGGSSEQAILAMGRAAIDGLIEFGSALQFKTDY